MTRRRLGMTLIELLIAVAIAAILATAVFSLFLIQARGVKGQQSIVDVQDNARIALDTIARDLRNAGFFVTPGAALRVEDDCAKTKLSYASGAWQIGGGGGTAAITNGDNAFTIGNDACPNGSDRLTIASRTRSDTAGCKNARGDLCSSEPGNNSPIERIPCDPGPCVGDCSKECDATLEKISTGLSAIAPCCGSGNQVLPQPVPVTVCNGNDPTQCGAANILEVHCCTDAGGGANNGSEIQLKLGLPPNGNSFGGDWGVLGGAGHQTDNTDLGGMAHRTYQILDYYHDGGSELVYSDQFYGAASLAALGASGTPMDPQWTVVADGVEDLQFAYQFKSGVATNTWVDDRSLWDLPNCATGATVDCLQTHYGAAPDPLIAIRVSMVVRSATPEAGLDGERPPLEDNLATPTPGGQGYRRRVLSTIIGLRNLSQ